MEPQSVAVSVQLAFAPIFLLAGIGAFLNVMTVRLSRVVDRARVVEGLIEAGEINAVMRHQEELKALDARITFVNRAIFSTTFSALLICLVVALLFAGQLTPLPVTEAVAVLFVATMTMLMVGLVSFLLEISVASKTLHVRRELLR